MTETVAPSAVPRRTLASGATMPAIGFGTFGSDQARNRKQFTLTMRILRGGERCGQLHNHREYGDPVFLVSGWRQHVAKWSGS